MGVFADQFRSKTQCLNNEQPVERIAMLTSRQLGNRQGLLQRHRQQFNARPLPVLSKIAFRVCPSSIFPFPNFTAVSHAEATLTNATSAFSIASLATCDNAGSLRMNQIYVCVSRRTTFKLNPQSRQRGQQNRVPSTGPPPWPFPHGVFAAARPLGVPSRLPWSPKATSFQGRRLRPLSLAGDPPPSPGQTPCHQIGLAKMT